VEAAAAGGRTVADTSSARPEAPWKTTFETGAKPEPRRRSVEPVRARRGRAQRRTQATVAMRGRGT
jgi:hypothetical protein